MKKILILLLLIIPCCVFAQFTIKPEFELSTNDEKAKDDFYNLHGTMRFKFQATDDIELVFKPELDKYEVDIDEISAKYTFLEKHSVKGGKFENLLTLDDYLGNFDRVFARKNLVTREVKDQGYVSHAIGLKYEYRDRSKDGFGGFAHVVYVPSQFEPQLNLGFYWQDQREELLAGLFASYYPFINHENWGSEHCKSQKNNFIGDLVYSDYRHKIIYGAEFTLGSNLINPVGHINFDPDTEHPAFAGADLHCGIKVEMTDYIQWLPMLRGTMLIPEISEAKCNEFEVIWGNQFTYKEHVK
ncbi:MAG: hypothetical protein IJT92_01695, partial [Spirochaetia bacterium]|nr:hypothetical protein [Spirochaetia bacterium]